MRYGEWLLGPWYVEIQECDCIPTARCGCAWPRQCAWSLDMDSDVDDPPHTGFECMTCGATWMDGET